jgi:class 3 adenylate cyclase
VPAGVDPSGTLAAGAAMSGGERPTGTLTLVFSDMEGSTRLARALGDRWPALLARHREVLRGAVETEGGTVVDCQGDSMFAVFGSASAGVRAASEAQRRMAAEPWPDGLVVRVRIGVHTGEPAPTADGGYAGVDVSHAARLCAAGHGGQVLLSDSARLVSGAETISLGTAALPDIEPAAAVHQLVGDGLGREFPPLRTTAHPPPTTPASGPEGFEARIERAARSFEQRLGEHIAGTVERAFGWSPGDSRRG